MKSETGNELKALRTRKINGNELEELLKTTNVLRVNKDDLEAGSVCFELGDDTVVCSTEEQTYSPYYSEDTFIQYRLIPLFRIRTEDYMPRRVRTYETKRPADDTVLCRSDEKNYSPYYSEDIHFGYFLIPI